jgi:hypothetical protein
MASLLAALVPATNLKKRGDLDTSGCASSVESVTVTATSNITSFAFE